MGNRSKGKGGKTGNRDGRTKIRSSGMKQRGKGAASGYRPDERANRKAKK